MYIFQFTNCTSDILGKFCGVDPLPTLHVYASHVVISFASDYTVQQGGFDIFYKRDDPLIKSKSTMDIGILNSYSFQTEIANVTSSCFECRKILCIS